MPNKVIFGEKEFTFKRPVLSLTAKVDEVIKGYEVFQSLTDIVEIRKANPERFAELERQFKEVCGLVFVSIEGLPNLDDLVYPDEVNSVWADFFVFAWEQTILKVSNAKGYLKNIKGTA